MESAIASTGTPAAPATTILCTISVPPIGAHWVEQGGIFAGIMRGIDGAPDCALIIAADPRGHFEDREWGPYPKDAPAAAHQRDGMANTVAMDAGGSQLARDILALDIGGHNDWYLPSQAELHLACANVPDRFEKGDWYWSSTQDSPCYAWVQDFDYGYSTILTKLHEFRAVAVRRLAI